jgi:uncharacterized protein (TIGR02001 family)
MKNSKVFLLVMIALIVSSVSDIKAQEAEKKASPFSLGADFYSNYIWRGTKFGSGPAFQPTVKFSTSGLTLGVWGSFDASGYTEADAFISYGFKFGLTLGLTDYYYPGLDYFDYSDTSGAHAFEINAGYTFKGLSLSANYILNEAGGAASVGGDKYFEVGYSFTNFKLFAGAGDGWHTSDGDFAVCNLGLSTWKTIDVTDKFSVPVSGSVILNPERKQLFLVVGFSL